jgi:hypothetical protein
MNKATMAKLSDAEQEDGYDVTFVNIMQPGQLQQRETRRAIRRRVMRDIGKSRRKRSRPITVSIDIPPATFTHPGISKSLYDYSQYAVEPDTRARQLLHFSRHLFIVSIAY